MDIDPFVLPEMTSALLEVEPSSYAFRGSRTAGLFAELEQFCESCRSISAAAEDSADALEACHRSLYLLYADRIWRPPPAPRPSRIQQLLDSARFTLEHSFRSRLERRREELAPPETVAEWGGWFNELASGHHPAENPAWAQYLREGIDLEELRWIVRQRSLFLLRESDPWIFALPRSSGAARAGLIDVMLDRQLRSAHYVKLMLALELDPELDAYEESADWQYLATLNHQWMLALTPELSPGLLGVIYLAGDDVELPSGMVANGGRQSRCARVL
jgi:hypothetical protein